jgi:hypothetical protein
MRGLLTSAGISRSLEPHAGQAGTLSSSHKCKQWPHINEVNSCCSPSQRMNEIGVLLALVATPADCATLAVMDHRKRPLEFLFLQVVGEGQRRFGLYVCNQATELAQPELAGRREIIANQGAESLYRGAERSKEIQPKSPNYVSNHRVRSDRVWTSHGRPDPSVDSPGSNQCDQEAQAPPGPAA